MCLLPLLCVAVARSQTKDGQTITVALPKTDGCLINNQLESLTFKVSPNTTGILRGSRNGAVHVHLPWLTAHTFKPVPAVLEAVGLYTVYYL